MRGQDSRGLVLNVGRGDSLRELFGDNTDRWIGRRFRLVIGTATFQGKRVRALHVEAVPGPTKPVGTARSAPPEPEPELPTADNEVPSPDDPAWAELNA